MKKARGAAFMKKFIVTTAAAATGLTASIIAVSAAEATPAQPPASSSVSPSAGSIAWSPCPTDELFGLLKGLECGSLEVPLDHSQPDGRQITLALSRAKHTAPDSEYQGIVLLNRGQWPGGIGRDLPTRFAKGTTGLPTAVGSTYDWIGLDPRGVGASEPMVTCDPSYVYPGHAEADPVPRTAEEEQEWLRKAREYAESCGRKYGDVLDFLTTKDTARDLDLIRQALGQEQINYLGYDWGTYLGSVYASMFPDRVRRMVLDSVVRPSTVGYKASLVQNEASEKRAQIYFAWIAKYDSVYHLGDTVAEVEANYYKGMAMITAAPIDGKIGPAEYTDIFAIALYRNYNWVRQTQALADWVLRQDPRGLKAHFSPPGYPHENKQAMYNAVQCTDDSWPHNWQRWHSDITRQYREGNTFMTWRNAWYNAPCLFWPAPASKPLKVGDPDLEILLVQPENDAAHSVEGAYEMHKLFPNSRLVLELGGNNHGGAALSANANACVNSHVIAYLRDGTVPDSEKGVDAFCQANPDPVPPGAQSP